MITKDISQFGKGALIQPLKLRDYRLELLPSAEILPTSYSLKDKVGKIKNQNGSGSCVSQAVAYYTEVLNAIETGEKIELSPRFLYPFVYLGFGSYIKDNMARVCNEGIALESDVPSYENGNPPTEKFMTTKPEITNDTADRAKTYIAKKYVTWDNINIDFYKRAIWQGNGCVVASWGNNPCWQRAEIQLPAYKEQMNWMHGIYLTGWDDSKKVFEFVNSWGVDWGDKGYGYLPYEYITKGYVSNPMTMIDVPNDTYVKLTSQIKNLAEMIIKLLLKKISLFK